MNREELEEVVRTVIGTSLPETARRFPTIPVGNVQMGVPEQISREIQNDGRMSDGIIDLSITSGGGGSSTVPGCYAISSGDDDHEPGDLLNCYLMAGGMFVAGPTGNAYGWGVGIIAIKVDNGYAAMEIVGNYEPGELISEQARGSHVFFPLYYIDRIENKLVASIDFRNIPRLDMWGFYGF